jgi:hypothetical protein
MRDHVFDTFLEEQYAAGMALAESSDILELAPLGGPPTQQFIATLSCRGKVGTAASDLRDADRFRVGVFFPMDYLRRAEFMQVIQVLSPRITWHPNVNGSAICVGHMPPGTPLVSILYQVVEILTYRRYTPREDNALNFAACQWARAHQGEFPLDHRPLRRSRLASA